MLENSGRVQESRHVKALSKWFLQGYCYSVRNLLILEMPWSSNSWQLGLEKLGLFWIPQKFQSGRKHLRAQGLTIESQNLLAFKKDRRTTEKGIIFGIMFLRLKVLTSLSWRHHGTFFNDFSPNKILRSDFDPNLWGSSRSKCLLRSLTLFT